MKAGFQHESFFILERRFCGLLSVTHIYRRFTFLTEINDQSFSQIFEINSRKTKKKWQFSHVLSDHHVERETACVVESSGRASGLEAPDSMRRQGPANRQTFLDNLLVI